MANPTTQSDAAPAHDSGWGLALAPAICEACDRRYLLPSEWPAQQCPHCRRAELTTLTEAPEPPQPELLLPFSVSEGMVRARLEDFAGGIWFAPADLTAANLQKRVQLLYLPMWLVDSQATGTWQAEVGFYYEAVTHQEKFDENRGGWRSHQVTERRVRWEPRLGRLERTYHNITAPALEEHSSLLAGLGRYQIEAAEPYQPAASQKGLIRLPDRSPADAWPDAKPGFREAAAEECRRAAGADQVREFHWTPTFQAENWTLLLLPAYVTYYLDDEQQPHPVLLHGQSGQVSGPRLASSQRARRVALALAGAAALIFVLSLIVALVSIALPPLLLFAGLGVGLAVLVGAAAVAPLLIVRAANQPSTKESNRKRVGGR